MNLAFPENPYLLEPFFRRSSSLRKAVDSLLMASAEVRRVQVDQKAHTCRVVPEGFLFRSAPDRFGEALRTCDVVLLVIQSECSVTGYQRVISILRAASAPGNIGLCHLPLLDASA